MKNIFIVSFCLLTASCAGGFDKDAYRRNLSAADFQSVEVRYEKPRTRSGLFGFVDTLNEGLGSDGRAPTPAFEAALEEAVAERFAALGGGDRPARVDVVLSHLTYPGDAEGFLSGLTGGEARGYMTLSFEDQSAAFYSRAFDVQLGLRGRVEIGVASDNTTKFADILANYLFEESEDSL